MKYTQEIIDFWKNDNFKNITAGGKEFPEGWNVRPFLKNIVKDDSIIEMGCGYGRLTPAFSKEQYIGYDINPSAIKAAKNNLPEYDFRIYEIGQEIEKSEWLMFYTVLLHINDNDIENYLSIVSKNTNKVLIAEILGRKRWGNVWKYAFNRDIEHYDEIFESLNFKRKELIEKPYMHYNNTNISFITYEKIE